MTRYLLDTNVVLRFSNPLDAQHTLTTDAVSRLAEQGNECVLTAQVLIEFWVVATRPLDVNGLGWSMERVQSNVAELLNGFSLLEDRSEVFPNWLELVSANNIKGKRSHDIRLVAVMLSHNVDHLLTFNPDDFAIALPITIVHPQRLQ
ncbi:MAG TPA: type II toxin-antitoxin system VapC family toxin [Leptolyngbya sp.]|jgi:predicted nucleic acid-binding protein|nr:type II toxin-antitoxin system VapC family toxin [Leptolyngbya sp.]